MISRKSCEVIIGSNRFSFHQDGDALYLDNESVDASLVRLGENVYLLTHEGRPYRVYVDRSNEGSLRVVVNGIPRQVRIQDERARLMERYGSPTATSGKPQTIAAPMPGLVLAVHVEQGERVSAGQALLVLEAMKMENELRASVEGIISAVHVGPGQAVTKGSALVELTQSADGT